MHPTFDAVDVKGELSRRALLGGLTLGSTLLLFGCSSPAAADREPDFERRRLWICGGGTLPAAVVAGFMAAGGGERGRLVLIPTASASADDPAESAELLTIWRSRGAGDVAILHTRDRQRADSAEFVEPLARATAIWFGGGAQERLREAYLGTAVEAALHAAMQRGVVIGGTSAGAAIQSRVMIESGNPVPKITTGLGFLPEAILDQHFRARNRAVRLRAAVAAHPHLLGLGIDESTALVVDGRRAEVVGEGGVTEITTGGERLRLPGERWELRGSRAAS
ncbi:MAG: cyanophycinase [Planctomycetota bacterium]